MEIYGRVRRAVLVEGRSQRSVAREFGLARVTVHKMLGYSIPPGYRRKEPAKRPKLGPWVGVIETILEEDKTKPVKQRHTAKRIFDRLRAEQAFPGGYTIVKDYVRALAPPAAPASDRLGSADPASRQKLRPPFRNPMIAKWLALQETLGRLVSRLPCRQAERVRQHGLNPSRQTRADGRSGTRPAAGITRAGF